MDAQIYTGVLRCTGNAYIESIEVEVMLDCRAARPMLCAIPRVNASFTTQFYLLPAPKPLASDPSLWFCWLRIHTSHIHGPAERRGCACEVGCCALEYPKEKHNGAHGPTASLSNSAKNAEFAL